MNHLTETDIKTQLANLDGVQIDGRSTDSVVVYSLGGEIVATVKNNSNPVVVSLRCDPNLAKLLRENYESVLEGQGLNKRHFITILLTGQLSDDDISDQIRHAYEETKAILDDQSVAS